MAQKFKLRQTVKVEHPKISFEGVILAEYQYIDSEKREGFEYMVRNNESKEIYRVDEKFIKSKEI